MNQQIGALEYRIGTLEAFLDFDPKAPADDVSPCTLFERIADELTGVTTHCEARIDALLREIKALRARLDALETKTPC